MLHIAEMNSSIFISQELIAYGISNIVGSLFSSFSSSGSISRSALQVNTGGKTQVSHLIAFSDQCTVHILLMHLQTCTTCILQYTLYVNSTW